MYKNILRLSILVFLSLINSQVCKAQLGCPALSSPFEPSITINPSTGFRQANICLDSNGKFIVINGGGNVTTVTVNPVTCTVGQQYFNTTTGQLLLCNATNSIVTTTGSLATVIDSTLFGVKAAGKTCAGPHLVTTSASPNISCDLTGFFSASDVGRIAFVTQSCCTQQATVKGIINVPQTTVLSFTDANHIVLNANATISSGANNDMRLWIVDNEDAAYAAIDAAIAALPLGSPCPIVLYARGISGFQNIHWNTSIASCSGGGATGALTNGYSTGPRFQGFGSDVSILLALPNFATVAGGASSCSGSNNGCLFKIQGVQLVGFSVNGGGAGNLNGSFNQLSLIQPGSGFYLDDFFVNGWYTADAHASNIGLDLSNGGTIVASGSIGAGGHSCATTSAATVRAFGMFCNASLNEGLQVYGNANVYCKNCAYGINASGSPLVRVGLVGAASSGTYFGDADAIQQNDGNHVNANYQVEQNSTMTLTNTNSTTTNAAGMVGLNVLSGSTAKICNDNFTGGAAGNAVTNAGTIIETCRNTYGTTVTNTGSWFNQSLSATGTALVIGNVGLTSGWATSTVTSIGANSDGKQGRFTITAAGSPGSNPVVTLTFPTSWPVAASHCTFQQTAGTFGVLTNPVSGTATTTTVTMTLTGTAVATQTYTFDYNCGP